MTKHGNYRHGHSSMFRDGAPSDRLSREYIVWTMMKSRCLNPRNKSFPDYGGAGIGVCERWLVFENFLADMGPKPSRAHSIERIDNTKGYAPGNCRWATMRDQSNNRRSNVLIAHAGKSMTVAQWAREVGVPYATFWWRLRTAGWTFEEACQPPTQ